VLAAVIAVVHTLPPVFTRKDNEMTFKTFTAALAAAALTALTAQVSVAAHHEEEELPTYAERTSAIEVSAEVVSVDMETRTLVLAAPDGEQFTTVVDPAVERLSEFAPGDRLVVVYLAALGADLREPTEEELANPWVEGVEAGRADAESGPGGAIITGVRAVCTIEGMNRLTGTVTILDSRGVPHIIGDVSAERIETLRVGQSVVMTFTQAVAIELEKVDAAGDN
jgi:hypothetical protein